MEGNQDRRLSLGRSILSHNIQSQGACVWAIGWEQGGPSEGTGSKGVGGSGGAAQEGAGPRVAVIIPAWACGSRSWTGTGSGGLEEKRSQPTGTRWEQPGEARDLSVPVPAGAAPGLPGRGRSTDAAATGCGTEERQTDTQDRAGLAIPGPPPRPAVRASPWPPRAIGPRPSCPPSPARPGGHSPLLPPRFQR